MDAMVRRMVDLAAGLEYEHLPEAAVHAAKARLIDSMGVAIGALDAPPVRAASRIAQPTTGRYRSRLLGTGTATTPDMAAFVNGTMVRYLDFNDAYRTLDASHPSDNLPGVLAMTEALGAAGGTSSWRSPSPTRSSAASPTTCRSTTRAGISRW